VRARAGSRLAAAKRPLCIVEAVAVVVVFHRYRQQRAFLEDVHDADVVPHTLRKVRIEVAVENRVTRRLVTVADAAIHELVGMA